jgi:Tfp pilus assembly PilM family ATPase
MPLVQKNLVGVDIGAERIKMVRMGRRGVVRAINWAMPECVVTNLA